MTADDDLQATYDLVADDYVRHIFDELDHKPFDREVLDRFAARVRDRGPVLDLGCGPGHITRYLHERGVTITGVDLSAALIERARVLSPGLDFVQGDMYALARPAATIAGLVAFYSIVHMTPKLLAAAFAEMRRVLQPGAPLLLAFHIGDERVHLDEWWGHAVSVDFYFFEPAAITARLGEAGLHVVESLERPPYPDVEYASRRAYLLAEAVAS